MPAKDFFHDAVCASLVKDGWTITDDPLTIPIGGRSLFVDLGAERLLAAEKGADKIAVEVKSFLGPSPLRDLELTWGQFFLYSRALQKREPERRLYLAINETIFESIFQEEAAKLLLNEPGFHLIVFDANSEEVTQWII